MAVETPEEMKQNLDEAVKQLYATMQTQFRDETIAETGELKVVLNHKESQHAPPTAKAELSQEGFTLEHSIPMRRVNREVEKRAERSNPDDLKQALEQNVLELSPEGADSHSDEDKERKEKPEELGNPDIKSIITNQ